MMASSWVRMKMYHFGKVKVSRLVTPVLVFSIVFIVYRALSTSPPRSYGVVRPRKVKVEHPLSAREINRHLGMMEDTRPALCRDVIYNKLTNDFYRKVSVILDYRDEQFYHLKLTLHSIFLFTPSHQISEIVVIDDGSTNEEIRQHAAEFFQDPKFSEVKVYRSEEQEGQSASRLKGAKLARGWVLVFVSSEAVVNQGWLQPLLAQVHFDSRVIAVPHHDNFLPGYRFFALDNDLINVPTWSLTTVYMESSTRGRDTLNTPVMRGEVFAVDRGFLEELGGPDETIGSQGGHNLELSLRAWMCGGRLVVAVCSRVAVHSTLRPLEVGSVENTQHIAELWLDDYKHITYRQTHLTPSLSPSMADRVKLRKTYLKTTLEQCHSFDWYLHSVAQDLIVPSQHMQLFGKVKAQTNFCLRSQAPGSSSVEMELCRPHIYDKMFLFEMDTRGFIRMGDRCLGVSAQLRLQLEACKDHESSDSSQQQWSLDSEGRLRSQAMPHTKCASQVSERDSNRDLRHYVMMLECGQDAPRTQLWSFLSY